MTNGAIGNHDAIIRPATEDDHRAILDVYNRAHADSLPVTLEEYRAILDGMPEGARMQDWVAEQDGTIVGALGIQEEWGSLNPGVFSVYLEVDEPYRRRGIGSMLYAQLTTCTAEVGARRLYNLGEIREDDPDGLAFARKRGFEPTGHVDRQSRLKVCDARLDELPILEERLAGQRIDIRTLAEIGTGDERFMRALHAMNEESMQDMPSPEPLSSRPFEYWVEQTLKFPGNSPAWTWVATDRDRPVGIARLRRSGNFAFNAYTGVDREYRGRGIARAMKLKSVQWAQKHDIEYIYTGNEESNRRMLDINLRMGYEPLPARIAVVKEL